MNETIMLGGDLTVHRLGFGAMRITGDGIWGEPRDRAECERVLRRAIELGVNFFDTADSYGPEVSERLIAETLHPYPKDLVIATKGGLLRGGPGDWRRDCSPKHLRDAIEGSLKRLRLDRIDVYQLHAIDDRVPLEDSVGTLAELKKQGKIRHVALSNVSVAQLEKAQSIVEIVSVQNRYGLHDRGSEAVLKACEKKGLAFIPYFPLAAGKAAQGEGELAAVAKKHGVKTAQIALSWLLHHSNATLPIPGTSKVAHLQENVAAADIDLDADDMRKLSGG